MTAMCGRVRPRCRWQMIHDADSIEATERGAADATALQDDEALHQELVTDRCRAAMRAISADAGCFPTPASAEFTCGCSLQD